MGLEHRIQPNRAWAIVTDLVKSDYAAHITVLENRITEQATSHVCSSQVHAPKLGLIEVAISTFGVGHIRPNH